MATGDDKQYSTKKYPSQYRSRQERTISKTQIQVRTHLPVLPITSIDGPTWHGIIESSKYRKVATPYGNAKPGGTNSNH